MRAFRLFALLCLIAVHGAGQSVFPVRDEGQARDKVYDVLHYVINVAIDEVQKEVTGTVTATLVPYRSECRLIEFDAEQMNIRRVMLRGKSLPYEVRPKTLAVTLDRPYSFHDTLVLAIDYSCKPVKGLYFVQPDSAYPDKPWQIWSQGEDMDNHFWFPCYDFPNGRATTELIATVRSKYTVLSNGALVSTREDKKRGMKTFHWMERHPHVSYLVMIAVGEYAILRDTAGTLPLEYYVYPHHTADARICFSKTPEMIKFFNEKIGFPYPWEKYAQVLIKDFVVGGMENTSATSLADESTVYDARARLDDSPTSLIAHELAHQWWGDVVTCRDWRHLWLNESFASYFDPLYHEYLLGRNDFDVRMYDSQQAGINTDRDLGRKPIVSVGSYGANIYPRGASVLHMLRYLLGDELFWKAINHYITKHQFQTVETNDFKVAIEEATGQNLYWFFDQWVYKAGHPVFDLSYAWNDTSHSVSLHVTQSQTIDSLTGVFRTPVDIEISTPQGPVTHRVFLHSRDTTLVLAAPGRPILVIFDRGNWLLKELRWSKSDPEWMFQAEQASNPVDRLRAIQVLRARQDSVASTSLLARIAAADPFWAVRQEAVNALGKLTTRVPSARDSIRQALIVASRDLRPSVRAAAISHMANFKESDVVSAIRKSLLDSSYNVVASALRALARSDSANALPVLTSHLDIPSHGSVIAAAALSGMQSIDSTMAVRLAAEKVRYGQPGRVRFTALGILQRHAKHDRDLFPLFVSLASDKNPSIQSSALRTLGDIGDASVLPLLDTLAGEPLNRSATAARESAEKIRKRLEAN
jgi:aminopeptidase N